MKTLLIAFRGRNTDAIVEDSKIVSDHKVILSLPNDRLKQEDDLTVEQFFFGSESLWNQVEEEFKQWDEGGRIHNDGRPADRLWRVVLIANGGTTKQLVRTLLILENTYVMTPDYGDARQESELYLSYVRGTRRAA